MTADQIMDEEFCDSMFDKLEPHEFRFIKDAMKVAAELAFDAGYRRGFNEGGEIENLTHPPHKEQFISQLFTTKQQP